MKLIRTIVNHSRTCRQKDKSTPWSGLISGEFYGNFAANKILGGHHKWYTISCNDPNCLGTCAIHSKVLRDIASFDFEVKELDYSKNQIYQL